MCDYCKEHQPVIWHCRMRGESLVLSWSSQGQETGNGLRRGAVH